MSTGQRHGGLWKAASWMLAVLLVAGLMPAPALAATTPRSLDDGSPQQARTAPDSTEDAYGTDVGPTGGAADMAEGGAQVTTDVSVAVLNDFSIEVSLDQPYFDYTHQPAAPNDAIRVVIKGGSKFKEGEPYTWEWTRERRGVTDRDFVPDPDPASSWMRGRDSVECQLTSEGATLAYPLWKDKFRERMTYRYVVKVMDAAGQELSGEAFVYYGWPYAPGWASNGATRDTKTEISARAMLLGNDDGTRSQLVVEDVASELLPELYPLAEGYVIDSISNVSCTNALTDEEHPAYITPPSISLSIRLRDADAVDVGTPVKVLSIQDGRPVVVAESQVVIDDITVDGKQSPNFGCKIARVGNFAQNIWYQTGVDELGVFAVAYLPPDAEQRQMKVTSQAKSADGEAAADGALPGGAVVPADTARVYMAGTTVRYTFLPEYGHQLARVVVGTNPTGREGTCVFDPSRNIYGDGAGANFYDLVVPTPADAGGAQHIYVTAFYEQSPPPDPTDPDDPYKPVDPTDPDPYEPLDPADPDGPKRGFIVRAEVASGVGQVAIEGADEADAAGGQWASVHVVPTGSAVVSFLPGEVDGQTYVLDHVTLETKDIPEMELSVLNLRYVLASVTADTTIRAHFREGSYLPRTRFDVTYAQVDADTGVALAAEDCGWAFVEPPASVYYGNPLAVVLSQTDADKAKDWTLESLTFNGEAAAPRAAARTAGFASYLKDYITSETHVQAAFKKVADPDDPDDPNKPDNPDDPDNPGGDKPGGDNGNNGGTGSTLCTVTASSEGHGSIAPAGTMQVAVGTQLVFTLKPDAAYRPAAITITDAQGTRKVRTSSTTYTLKVTGNTEVKASFAAQAVPVASGVDRLVHRLKSLATTGDLNAPIALALAGAACAAAGVILLTKRRRSEGDAA